MHTSILQQEIFVKKKIENKLIEGKLSFYKQHKKRIIPIEDVELNELAIKKLDKIKKEYFGKIPSRYLNNWDNVSLYHPAGDINKANSILIDPEDGAYSLDNKLNDLTGKEWTRFTKSWFVFDALASDLKEEKNITSKARLNSEDHPATYSPTMMSEFISFFTKELQIVLDPFCGIGSTLVGCERTNRKGIGIELNTKYSNISKLRTKQVVVNDDSNKIKEILNNLMIDKIDFSISSPPYWNILHRSTGNFENNRISKKLDIKYSEDHEKDLGNIHDYEVFLQKVSKIYLDIYDFLKMGGYLVVIVKNIKKKGKSYTLAWDLANSLSSKYALKDEKIWCQDKVGLSPFGYPFAWTSNIVHHYCLVFRKEAND